LSDAGDPDEPLDAVQAAEEAVISRSTLYAYVSTGQCPDPDDTGHGVKRWRRSTVRAAPDTMITSTLAANPCSSAPPCICCREHVRFGRVEIRADRDAAALVGGIDQPVESLGCVGPDGKQPDVIDHQVGTQDTGDRLGDRVVGAVRADQRPELLQGEPGDVLPGLDGRLAQGLEQERLARPGRAADDEVLVPADPFQNP
jgi:predicted DNA-binding transcriptional regulator AlpA